MYMLVSPLDQFQILSSINFKLSSRDRALTPIVIKRFSNHACHKKNVVLQVTALGFNRLAFDPLEDGLFQFLNQEAHSGFYIPRSVGVLIRINGDYDISEMSKNSNLYNLYSKSYSILFEVNSLVDKSGVHLSDKLKVVIKHYKTYYPMVYGDVIDLSSRFNYIYNISNF